MYRRTKDVAAASEVDDEAKEKKSELLYDPSAKTSNTKSDLLVLRERVKDTQRVKDWKARGGHLKLPAAAPKAGPKAGIDDTEGPMTEHDTAKLMLLILDHMDPKFIEDGWKQLHWNSIGAKAQHVFNGEYSGVAVKNQFMKLREEYLESRPNLDKAGANADAGISESQPDRPAKRQKRAAENSTFRPEGDRGNGAVDKSKASEGEPARKVKDEVEAEQDLYAIRRSLLFRDYSVDNSDEDLP
ncbi:hypothetical protein GGR54DRAFT_99151 [Hypoxylon sp. NC1633]|nr:hypothetical protein GGR54DRAFT_99151 [Hypoxylon sp. NC1633]